MLTVRITPLDLGRAKARYQCRDRGATKNGVGEHPHRYCHTIEETSTRWAFRWDSDEGPLKEGDARAVAVLLEHLTRKG
jgi:hypothetical protein